MYNHRTYGLKIIYFCTLCPGDLETRKEPNGIEFFKRTRYNEKKGWISNEAESRYNRMMELQAQSNEEGSQTLTQDQICDTVLGTRPGCVCGLGHGPKPVGSSSRTRVLEYSNRELREELATQRELIQTMEARQQSIQARQEELEELVRRLSPSAPSAAPWQVI